MYTNRFGLTEDPFRVTPDRRYLFFGEVHGPVISKLRSIMVRPHGLCLLTGAPGVGKTLALQQAAGMLPDRTPVSLIYNAHLDFRAFLNAVLADFGVEFRGDADAAELLEQLTGSSSIASSGGATRSSSSTRAAICPQKSSTGWVNSPDIVAGRFRVYP